MNTRDLVFLRVPRMVGMYVAKLTGRSLWGAISDSQIVAWAENDAVYGSVFDMDTDPVPDPDHPNLDKFLREVG